MAEEEEDLILRPADAGTAFRAEMAATNFLLGYWKHLVLAVVLALAGILFYGWYADWYTRDQRESTRDLAIRLQDLPVALDRIPLLQELDEELANLPQEEPLPPYFAQMLGVPGTWTPMDVLLPSSEALVQLAGEVEQLGNDFRGTASVEAMLKAAELYRLGQDAAGRRRALEGAEASARGALHYAAVTALANLDIEEGQGDRAVERLRALSDQDDVFLAQRALLDLGAALEHLNRKEEAQQVYADFLVRWPDSKRADEVRSRQAGNG